MKRVLVGGILVLIVGFASAAFAQTCTSPATIGNFEVAFNGATFDGVNTRFDYCITGLDVPGFHALSNWQLSLAQDCIEADDIVSCGPEPCYYQVDDPDLRLTGIKFDDVEVDKGETVCYFFSLQGDWSNLIGDVSMGTKAATTTSIGNVCGPICRTCSADLSVNAAISGNPWYTLSLHHMRPRTVTNSITYQILNSAGKKVRSWTEGPVTLAQGGSYSVNKVIPGRLLTSGTYTLKMQLNGMSSWVTRITTFEIP